MSHNVIPLRKKTPERNPALAMLPRAEEPLAVSVPPTLAQSIRLTAEMHSKDPQEFLMDWLKSGFPENAA